MSLDKITKTTSRLPKQAPGGLALVKDLNDVIDYINEVVTSDTTLSTDTITEQTSGNGITIDSVVLKDGQVKPLHGTVSQATNITTGVTLNYPAGLITTQSASAAANAAHTFTVTNSYVTASSNIRAWIVDYAGTIATNGFPDVIVDNPGSGSFNIIIVNGHGTNALSGVLKIGFEVIA